MTDLSDVLACPVLEVPDKVVQLAIFLVLTLRDKARDGDVVHQPLIEENLQSDVLSAAPGGQDHEVG